MNPSYPGTREIDKKHNQEVLNIAKELGPCPKGGSHELKSHYTFWTLFLAFCLGLPRLFGYSERKTVCIKCNETFNITLPQAKW